MNRSHPILLLLCLLMSSLSSHAAGRETAFPLAGVPGGQQRSRYWTASDERAVFLCVHGIQSHAEWFEPLAKELGGQGITSYALDRRGSGPWSVDAAHPQHRHHAPFRGDVADWRSWTDDIRAAGESIRQRHPGRPLFLLAVSWGAKTALGALMEDPDKKLFHGGVLIAPALATTIDPPAMVNPLLSVWAGVAGGTTVDLKKKILPCHYTCDAATQARWLQNDPSLLQSVTHRFLAQSREQLHHAQEHLSQLSQDILTIYGTADKLVKTYESDQMLLPLRQDPPPADRKPRLTTLILHDLTHASLVEAPGQLARQIMPWMRARLPAGGSSDAFITLPAYLTGKPLKNGKTTASRADLLGKAHGLDTGIEVHQGQRVEITWDKEVWWQDAGLAPCTPGGCLKEVWLQKISRGSLILKNAPYLALLAHVRRSDGSTITTHAGFQKAETREAIVWTAPATGRLWLSANDATTLPKTIFTNNTGSLRLRWRVKP